MAINFHGRPCFTPAVKNENFVSEKERQKEARNERRRKKL
jgi:hypothetical protein